MHQSKSPEEYTGGIPVNDAQASMVEGVWTQVDAVPVESPQDHAATKVVVIGTRWLSSRESSMQQVVHDWFWKESVQVCRTGGNVILASAGSSLDLPYGAGLGAHLSFRHGFPAL